MYYTVNNFSGGLNKYFKRRYLKPNEAKELRNADISEGYLKPCKDNSLANNTVGGYYVRNYFADSGYNVWFTHNNPMIYVDWLGKVYKSSANELERPKKFEADGTDKGFIGIANPSSSPSLSEDNTVSTPFFKGDIFSYVYTFKTEAAESAPSPAAQIKLENDGVGIKVTTPLASDNGVDSIRIYRAGGGAAYFSLVAEFAGGEFTDDKLALELGEVCETWNNEAPPNGLILDCYYMGRFVGYVDNTSILRVSNITNIESWNSLHTLNFDSKIIRVIPYSGSLMVLCRNEIYQITGTDIDNFTKVQIPTEYGCVSRKSVIVYNNLLFWQSDDGICAFDGANVKLITKTKFPKSYFLNRELIAEAYEGVVYFGDENGILAFNMDFGYWQEYDSITGLTDMFYNKADDKLYLATQNELYTFQTSADNKSLLYSSPAFGVNINEDSKVNMVLKTFRSLQIMGRGKIDVKMYVDGELIAEYREISLDSVNPVLLFYPKQSRGFVSYVEFQGEGTVYYYSIEAYPEGVKRNG